MSWKVLRRRAALELLGTLGLLGLGLGSGSGFFAAAFLRGFLVVDGVASPAAFLLRDCVALDAVGALALRGGIVNGIRRR